MASTGKWTHDDVPKSGWVCAHIFVIGKDDPLQVCEMCETQSIRFVHVMEHPDFPEALEAGCICAGHMEDDVEGARSREQEMQATLARRARWLKRGWRTSYKGNHFVNTHDGFMVVVFRQGKHWGGVVKDKQTGHEQRSRRQYATEDDAKLAAFDALVMLLDRRTRGV